MSLLFSPLTIKSITLKNRIVVSPMCEYSSEDGFANDWHFVHLGSRAVGGASLIITEACSVSPEGRISFADLGIWKDEHISKLKNITHFLGEQGAIAGVQLAHAGRKGSHYEPWNGGKQIASHERNGYPTLAPSSVPFLPGEEAPVELSLEGIQIVISQFREAAIRAIKSGFKVIEIHAAHGYLIHQFLSPLSNFRMDQYGGSFENRIRILMEILDEIQQVWPEDLPILVRISCTEWTEGGWNIDDSISLSTILKSKGVDLIDCSSGGNVPHAQIPVEPGYQVTFAEKIRKDCSIMTGAVGLITGSMQAEDILKNHQADLIILGRQVLRDPYFPLRAAHELGIDQKWPVQYERGRWP